MRLYCVTTKYNHYASCPIEVGVSYEVIDKSRTWEDNYLMIDIHVDGWGVVEMVKKSFIDLETRRNKSIDKLLK